MKKTVVIRIVLFLLTLISFLTTTVFAWSTFVQRTQPIMFYSGRLSVEAKLFQLVDPNYDGIDLDDEYVEITESYEFTKLVPGQVFSFKIEVTNNGNIPGYLKLAMFINDVASSQFLDVMELSYENPETNDLIVNSLSYENLFFQNKYLVSGVQNKYTFYFKLHVKPELGNSLKSQGLIIEKFVVTLDQIKQ